MSNIDPQVLANSLARLVHVEDATESLESALAKVVEALVGVFQVTGAGLMFLDDGSVLRYVAASDEAVRVLEAVQEEIGVGPCIDSLVLGEVVSTADVLADDRWDGLGERVAAQGVRAVIGVPVKVGSAPLGSLNAYADEPHEWDPTEGAALQAYAALIEQVVGAAVLAHRQGRIVEQLEFALEHRVTVERAIGLLMGTERIDAVTAFDRLRRMARSSRRRVSVVAAELLERHGEP